MESLSHVFKPDVTGLLVKGGGGAVMESIWHGGVELFKQLELCAQRIAPEGNKERCDG